MKDSQIFTVALIIAILGLSGMILLSDKITPQEIKIKDLNKGMLDEDVSVVGMVEKIDKSPRSNTYFLQLRDGTGKTTAVVFDNAVLDLEKNNLTPLSFVNHRVKITGKVQQYNGNMELILNDGESLKILV
ncbi:MULTISPECIES: OB-fold nucleic acid binding domain-containing protein [Methanobacterium]|uniref:DNA-binding protein n=1 Tax=Methanobacterium bryantii TaxID=2161 RepID=A0A2A2H599_METBR|nr:MULTISPECIES: OB-fold nucleic acid binding domain-containing protein [Methanobacterium]OEC84440.1 DNA-binding protein [Methanobacterium sp. A39]PAV04562.1 DNA-binding protein [Methanobacterium bryantii]